MTSHTSSGNFCPCLHLRLGLGLFSVFVSFCICVLKFAAARYLAGIATALGYPAGFITKVTVMPFLRVLFADVRVCLCLPVSACVCLCLTLHACVHLQTQFFQRELVKMTAALGHRSQTTNDHDGLPKVSDTIPFSVSAFYALILCPAMAIAGQSVATWHTYPASGLVINPEGIEISPDMVGPMPNQVIVSCITLDAVLQLLCNGRLADLRHIGGLHGLMAPRTKVKDLKTDASLVGYVLGADPRPCAVGCYIV